MFDFHDEYKRAFSVLRDGRNVGKIVLRVAPLSLPVPAALLESQGDLASLVPGLGIRLGLGSTDVLLEVLAMTRDHVSLSS